jgi:hypothetical protein
MITIFNEHKDQFMELNYVVTASFKTTEAINTLFLGSKLYLLLINEQ